MAIDVRCLSCLAPYNLDESMRGKKVRCKQCSNVFVVDDSPPEAPVLEAEEEDIPMGEAVTAEPVRKRSRSKGVKEEPRSRRRTRDEEDDDDDAPRKKKSRSEAGSNTTLIVVLSCVGGGVFLLVLGVVGWLVFSAQSRPAPVAVAPMPFPNPPVIHPPGVNPPWPNVNPPVFNPPVVNPPPFINPPPIVIPPIVNPNPPAVVVPWRVSVDAPAQPLKPPADPGKTIPNLQSAPVLFPSRASSFVSIGKNTTAKDVRQIWNLETMQQVGTIPGRLGWQRDPIVLSPDGKYLAGKVTGGTTVEVYAVATGQKVQRFQVDPGFVQMPLVDFAGPDQLLTIKTTIAGIKQVHLAQVWDITTGAVRQFELSAVPTDAKCFSLSPSGKFLALIDSNANLAVYDLVQGRIAGTATVPKPPGVFVALCKGIAFSPDGVELAALFHSGVGNAQLVVWDVAKGTMTRQHALGNDALNKAQGALIYSGHNLVWVPDRSGWLVLGYYLVDAASGAVVYTVPGDLETGFASHRRMLSRDHLVAATGFGQTRQLKILALPRDQIGQPGKVGQPPAVAGLPAAKQADWSAVRQLPQGEGIAKWNVEIDAQPAMKLVAQPITLKGTGKEIDRILFAGKVGQAGVINLTVPTDPLRPRQVRIDRYNLATGMVLGSVEVGSAPRQGIVDLLADLSPEGTVLALVEPTDRKRIDLWSLGENKHLVGFLPYEKEADPKLRWAAALDEKRLLTLGGTGKLVLWSLPDCKAVWVCDGFQGVPGLSPTRKYLTGARGPTLVVLDVATGETRGQLETPAAVVPNAVSALAFQLDGKSLAGVVNMQLIRWDLTRGSVLGSSPAASPSRHLQWCGENHVLMDSNLYDIAVKATVATYMLPGMGKTAHGAPDGRFWFAFSRLPTEQAVLTSQTLPDVGTKQFAASLAQPGVQVLLRPGMSVSTQVNIAGAPPKLEESRKQALTLLEARLQTAGLSQAGGAPLTLQIQLQEFPTGKTVQYRPIGGRGGVQTVQVKQIQCQATLSGPGGVIWQEKRNPPLETPEPLTVNNENIQAMLDQQLWNNAAAWAGSLNLPSFAIRRAGGQPEFLPKRVALTGDR